MTPKIFIDGEVGTTGLQIRHRLAGRTDIEVISIDPAQRKDSRARSAMINRADVVILCLPDDAARESVGLVKNDAVRFIDASTAHRTHQDWTYGFPEMAKGQRDAIASARFVSNPGCYPTAFIALVRPLVEANLVPRDWPVTANAVSGYTGGGTRMIAEFEDRSSSQYTQVPCRAYALSCAHKHVPEMKSHVGLDNYPLFAPVVGNYVHGMILEVPLSLHALPGKPALAELHAVLAEAYAGERFVEVVTPDEASAQHTLAPQALNGSNRMKLYVFGSEKYRQARLVAVLDNLGKGASGAAVQNLNLMLGFEETIGLEKPFAWSTAA
jgi:N-acetyl-gamma-glutamyl-phosphate reductase